MSVNIDLTSLSGWSSLTDGTHAITVKAKASGYADSEASESVSVTKSSGYTITGYYGVIIAGSDDNIIYGKYNSLPTNENDYDFIYGAGHTTVPTAPSSPITSLYLWSNSYSAGGIYPAYGWGSYSASYIKAFNAIGYNNAISVDFSETISGTTFYGNIYLRSSYAD